MTTSIVHVLRHGEVHNPTGVLYGRLPDFHLSERGRDMAVRIADHLADAHLTHLVSSPLERAREIPSPYEFTVLQLYAAGLSYDEISQRLGKTRKSVDSAMFKVKHKLRRRAREVA